MDVEDFEYSNEANVGKSENKLLEHLTVGKDKLKEIERNTLAQADLQGWRNERKYRFTASNYGLMAAGRTSVPQVFAFDPLFLYFY